MTHVRPISKGKKQKTVSSEFRNETWITATSICSFQTCFTEKLDLLLAFLCDPTPTAIYDSASSKYLPFCSLNNELSLPGELIGDVSKCAYYSDDVCVKERRLWCNLAWFCSENSMKRESVLLCDGWKDEGPRPPNSLSETMSYTLSHSYISEVKIRALWRAGCELSVYSIHS